MSEDIAGVVLAAGLSRRMRQGNKLVFPIDGAPMVRHAVETALAGRLDPVVVVVAHQARDVEDTLEGLPLVVVRNRHPDDGLSSSLRIGIDALPAEVSAAVVLLGDMPWVRPDHVRRLVGAFDPESAREVCVPTFEGRRGNPVLWGARYFPEMRALSGDVGARGLIQLHPDVVHEVPMDDDAVLRDVDTPAELQAAAGRP